VVPGESRWEPPAEARPCGRAVRGSGRGAARPPADRTQRRRAPPAPRRRWSGPAAGGNDAQDRAADGDGCPLLAPLLDTGTVPVGRSPRCRRPALSRLLGDPWATHARPRREVAGSREAAHVGSHLGQQNLRRPPHAWNGVQPHDGLGSRMGLGRDLGADLRDAPVQDVKKVPAAVSLALTAQQLDPRLDERVVRESCGSFSAT
jgi:hypothetical protein